MLMSGFVIHYWVEMFNFVETQQIAVNSVFKTDRD